MARNAHGLSLSHSLSDREYAIPTLLLLFMLLFAARGTSEIAADDWPTYRHDQRRSGVTAESIEANRLEESWHWQSSLPPAPAWPDAARWDAYARLEGLRSMRNYDPVFHVAIVGNRVYVPSNSDDSVRCLDLETGELIWRYTVDAPVRIAPTIYEQQVLFGSDDGCVYSLDSRTGELVWRTEVASPTPRFINDGRLISFMPIRSGVLIDPDFERAIVSVGLFPWRNSLIAGLDLQTGEVEMMRDLGTGWTIEGSLLISPKHLIAPQGRAAPQLFDRESGAPAGALSGGGGSFVLLTDDDQILHGPGNKGGWITASNAESREKVASFDRGTAMIVSGDTSYLLDLDKLSAMDRETGEVLWSTPCRVPHELILAGKTLFAGGDDEVVAFDTTSGTITWRAEVKGRAQGIVVANGSLIVSTDQGSLHCFTPTGPELPVPELGSTTTNQLVAAPAPSNETSEHLLQRWVFHRNFLQEASNEDGSLSGEMQFRSLAESGNPALLPHGFRVVQSGEEQSWLLDGKAESQIAEEFQSVTHPEQAMTVEAWVRIDRPQAWGGLLSITQDNGSFEKGWILGYRNDRFGFALNGEGGPDRLTWLTDTKNAFKPTSWHHVAATYDGETIILYVDGETVAESAEQSGKILYPPKAAFHMGAYKDDDEHFPSVGMLNEVRLYDTALTSDEISEHAAEKRDRFPDAVPDREITESGAPPWKGPLLRFVSPGKASIQWWTQTPQATTLEIVQDGEVIDTLGQPDATTSHSVTIEGVRRDQLIQYRIVHLRNDELQYSPIYECDGHFDYLRPELPTSELGDNFVQQARSILSAVNQRAPRGLAVMTGSDDEGRLAEALCREGGLDVVILEKDLARALRTRERLIEAGVYGRPVSVRSPNSNGDFELPRRFADFVVALAGGRDAIQDRAEVEQLRLLVRPLGHLLLSPETLSKVNGSEITEGIPRPTDEIDGFVVQIPQHEGAAPWTHMYATPNNSAYAGETLAGVRGQDDLQVLWAGRPGPRYQSDRGNRKPSPLAVDGRLYMQGLHRVISVNAHNGTILWSWELPEVVRFNVPRDCSNWCADKDSIYIAARDRCMVLDGATGDVRAEYEVYEQSERELDWGYVARHGNLLLGSGVQSAAPFTKFWGGEHWYDSRDGEHAKKVCSDIFFARDASSGGALWNYENGLIVNPTITIADGRVHFVECRSESLKEGEVRRLEGDEFWNNLHLVALDVESGEKLWDIPAKPMPGDSAMYLVAAEQRLVLQTSKDGAFAVYVLNAETGEQVWRGKYDWEANHHGKHLSRPAVVEGKIYLRPLTLDLEDGTVLAEAFPAGHQCGTYTASRDALFLRAGSLAVWDRLSGNATRWSRARPDCWISTIPAEGMLLSPEGGGGCSCGGWIETSIGFIPMVEPK